MAAAAHVPTPATVPDGKGGTGKRKRRDEDRRRQPEATIDLHDDSRLPPRIGRRLLKKDGSLEQQRAKRSTVHR
jgi:hypothetical protein